MSVGWLCQICKADQSAARRGWGGGGTLEVRGHWRLSISLAHLRRAVHTGENDPFSFYAVQEYLCREGFIAKPHRAVETLWHTFKAHKGRCFCYRTPARWRRRRRGEHAHKARSLFTNIQSEKNRPPPDGRKLSFLLRFPLMRFRNISVKTGSLRRSIKL